MVNVQKSFTIRFSDEQYSPALRIDPDADPQYVIKTFGLITPRPTIFITGGAGNMTIEDIERTRIIMEEGIAHFAEKYHITVIDGGTEAGVMQMIGEARKKHHHKFPLVGVAPFHKVSFPGHLGTSNSAQLEAGHSHFVLVESEDWGGESQMIINLTRAIAAKQQPMIGILINGGRISERDVYLATTQGEDRIPILILEGSGRAADDISFAFKTKRSQSSIIRAIIAGGDIRLSPLEEGPSALVAKLAEHFGQS